MAYDKDAEEIGMNLRCNAPGKAYANETSAVLAYFVKLLQYEAHRPSLTGWPDFFC
jgi:hypothetical protein